MRNSPLHLLPPAPLIAMAIAAIDRPLRLTGWRRWVRVVGATAAIIPARGSAVGGTRGLVGGHRGLVGGTRGLPGDDNVERTPFSFYDFGPRQQTVPALSPSRPNDGQFLERKKVFFLILLILLFNYY